MESPEPPESGLTVRAITFRLESEDERRTLCEALRRLEARDHVTERCKRRMYDALAYSNGE